MGPGPRILFLCTFRPPARAVYTALSREFPDASWLSLDSREGFDNQAVSPLFDLVVAEYPLSWDPDQEAIHRLKDRWPDRPIVMFTLSPEDERTLMAEAAGRLLDPLFEGVRAALDKAFMRVQQRQAVEAARESEGRFRSVFESATDAIVLSDSEGNIMAWNRRATAMFGYAAEEALGRPLTLLMPGRYRNRHERSMERARAGSDGGSVGRTMELHGRRKDGSEFPIELSIGSWSTERGVYYSGVIRDITERRGSEERLRESYEHLRALSARIESVREEERAAIACEIHDQLGQSLTALRFDIAWIRNRVLSSKTPREALARRLDGMVEQVVSMMDHVRRISGELRPGVLDELGLVAAVEGHAREFTARTGIRCAVQAELAEERLEPGSAIALFRIIQESLTNIARHSGAKEARVSLRGGRGEPLEVEVRDDGRGITEAEAGSTAALGILGMRERAHAAGAVLDIRGAQGQGTVLSVRVPAPSHGLSLETAGSGA